MSSARNLGSSPSSVEFRLFRRYVDRLLSSFINATDSITADIKQTSSSAAGSTVKINGQEAGHVSVFVHRITKVVLYR